MKNAYESIENTKVTDGKTRYLGYYVAVTELKKEKAKEMTKDAEQR